MKTPKIWAILAFSTICAVSSPSFGQQRVFNWLPANDESVRLDPANYHSGRTYHPGSNGGNMHVDIKAQQPVTIFMADAAQWSEALQHPEEIGRLTQTCLREHVVETTYVCELPPQAMTLVIQDERGSPDRAVFTGLGAVLNPTTGIVDPSNKVERAVGLGIATIMKSRDSAPRHFVAPNDVHIQYYRWDCVENCIQPEYQWIEQVREKYDLTSFLKVYGGFVPDHDGTHVSIRIKSPVPMAIAMLPSQIADQLHAQPGALESALEKNTCQQRGVQSLQFQCTFNAEDGPQSLIAVPESTSNVPHKKAEIEMQAVKCVANCAPPPPLGKQ
ncbi:MAG: hypothetical protein DMG30_11120 [Acidobacteria bacterium]|nr:MAG: hypothetical protein DMG30_11120 [Acidobacteriota bacterium]